MATDNKAKFGRVLATLAEVYGRSLTPEMTAIYWSVFSKYPMDQIEQAARRHVETARFFPSPAELLDYMPASKANQHIGADEAWSLCIESFDEESTVVITQEIAEARGIAMAVYQSGDEIGARVAFRDAYNRIIKTSKQPEWFVSEGFDPARKADAIADAVRLGRLPTGSENRYRLEAPTATIAGLLEQAGKRDEAYQEKALSHLSSIKTMLLSMTGDDGIARREQERAAAELHRNEQLSAVAKRIGELH